MVIDLRVFLVTRTQAEGVIIVVGLGTADSARRYATGAGAGVGTGPTVALGRDSVHTYAAWRRWRENSPLVGEANFLTLCWAGNLIRNEDW